MSESYCPKCGSKVRSSDLYCQKCGASLSDNTAAHSEQIEQDIVGEDSLSDGYTDDALTETTASPAKRVAIASSILGVSNILTRVLFGPGCSNLQGLVAVVVGIVSLLHIRKQGSTGTGFAILGIVLGCLPVIITLIAILALAPTN